MFSTVTIENIQFIKNIWFSLLLTGSRPRLCLHLGGLVSQCWPGEDCSHLRRHRQLQPGSEFLVFTDTCRPPAACRTKLREKCHHSGGLEATLHTNSVSGREKEDEPLRILTLGIRRINIREDF